jgi:hypothetical protein
LSPAPHVGEVPGKPARHQEDGIDTNIVAVSRIAGRQPFRSDGNASQAIFVEGQSSRLLTAPLFDLDESQRAPASCDQIHLAAGNPCSPREDSPAAQAKPPCGQRFRTPPTGFCNVTIQALPASSSALA